MDPNNPTPSNGKLPLSLLPTSPHLRDKTEVASWLTTSLEITGSTGYAFSASWIEARQGAEIPIGPYSSSGGITFEDVKLQNADETTSLTTSPDNQHRVVVVLEGTVEVTLQDVPVFTISRRGAAVETSQVKSSRGFELARLR